MRITPGEQADLTGSLLVALPSLLDPNFRRTILFLVRHDPAEGAMGVILNRPTESRLPDLDTGLPEDLGNVPVYEGGPVEKHQLILARMATVGSGADFEALGRDDCRAIQDLPEGELRAFAGYAGWSAGQLEREIAEKSWIVMPPSTDLLAAVSSPGEGSALWRGLMRSLGPLHHLMSGAPDDLSLN